MMTPAQVRFVNLERKKEEVKRFFDELNEACEAVVNEIGVDGFFQDDDGTVYQVVVPAGKFVHFEKYSYNRTKRKGEERGTLSVKKAEEAGFIIPK